jgi:uncharacterized protein (DUF433 family)
MTVRLINQGVYDAREAAQLIGVPVDLLVRWSTANAAGQPAIVKPAHRNAFSFTDLVSLAVAATLHRRGVGDAHLRRGVKQLVKRAGVKQPLAQREIVDHLGTCGKSFLWNDAGEWIDVGSGGQGTFKAVVKIDLRKVAFDDGGVATAWNPAEHVILDPRVQAGAPVVSGTRIPTATIEDLAEAQSVDEIAEEYRVPVVKVRAALEFQRRLRAGEGLAA